MRRSYSSITVFTNGCFDLLHLGHIFSLQFAKMFGDVLIVGISCDEWVKKYKGNDRPIVSEKDRKAMLQSLKCVDQVIIFREPTPFELIKKIRPDILVKGREWEECQDRYPEFDFVRSYGGQVIFLERLKGYSTTDIVKRIRGTNESA